MRIFKDRYYLMKVREYKTVGMVTASDKFDYYITTGYKACNDRTRVVEEYKPRNEGTFRLEDGHLPDCQPLATEHKALEWLDDNPYQRIIYHLAGTQAINGLHT